MNRRRLILLLVLLSGLIATVVATSAQDAICVTSPDPAADLAFYIGQGQVYFDRSSYGLAINAYNCALAIDPDYAPGLVKRGYALAAQRADAEALADYNRALEIDPDSIAAYNNRGLLYTSQGNFGPALDDFDQAIELNADYAVAYHNRGVVYAAQGEYELAIADFEQAIALDENYADPHAALGAVHLAQAAANYVEYERLAGERYSAAAGDAGAMLGALEQGLDAGNFAVWLPLLTPSR